MMRLPWPWRRPKVDNREVREALRHLEQRDDEVTRLGRELREARRRNHFSDMVNAAIARAAPKENGT